MTDASTKPSSSRLPGFYQLSVEQRRVLISEAMGLDLAGPGFVTADGRVDVGLLDGFVENVIGGFGLPLGVAVNFVVDGREVLVPMAVEESSVVAAASNMARLVRKTGGFTTTVLEDKVIGQVQIMDVPDGAAAVRVITAHRDEIIAAANALDPILVAAGGGCCDLECRLFGPQETGAGTDLVVHLLVDPVDAMGANVVNTMCEQLAPRIAALSGGRAGLRILSNLASRRRFSARCSVRAEDLAVGELGGSEVAERIVAAARFAVYDPHRAATHNKGIMNGIDPIVVATGNDWRAVEAGAHAWAARDGQYRSLSNWQLNEAGDLVGELELPLQVGTVGGVTRLHPVARFSLALMEVSGAQELARIIAAVGLSQNLGALRALATEGIQRGHMRLHQRNLELSREMDAGEV